MDMPPPSSAPAVAPSANPPPAALAVYHPMCLEHRVPQDLAVEVPKRLEVAMAAIDLVERDYPELVRVERRPPPVELKWVHAVHDASYVLRMSQKIATAKELPLHVTQTTQEEEMEDQSGVCALTLLVPFIDVDLVRDTFATERSWDAALHAAGAVCLAVGQFCFPFVG